MASKWICRSQKALNRPVSFQELAVLVQRGQLGESDEVRNANSTEWIRIHRVVGLMQEVQRQSLEKGGKGLGQTESRESNADSRRKEPGAGNALRRRRITFLVAGFVLGVSLLYGGVYVAQQWNGKIWFGEQVDGFGTGD